MFEKATRRGHPLAVVGVPKTIDNDVAFVTRSFGYLTAIEEAAKALDRAHTEARSVANGLALVKLMGRHAEARHPLALASCLRPERADYRRYRDQSRRRAA